MPGIKKKRFFQKEPFSFNNTEIDCEKKQFKESIKDKGERDHEESSYEVMVNEFERVLTKYGFEPKDAKASAGCLHRTPWLVYILTD